MFTSLLPCDVEVLTWAIFGAIQGGTSTPRRLKFLEIGVFGGDTARGVKQWCDENKVELEYWGVDNGSHPNFKEGMKLGQPFEGAHMVYGDSAEVFHLVPDGFDVALIDGDHSFNHVVLDVIHYGRRVRKGGYLMMHDTSLEIQHTMREQHGPDIPEFYNSVLDALDVLDIEARGFVFEYASYAQGALTGGMRAYLKIR